MKNDEVGYDSQMKLTTGQYNVAFGKANVPSKTIQKEKVMSVRFFDVTSSNIKQIGYDQKKMVLVIRFKKGGEYHYSNFLESDWALFCSCESVGKHFHSHINKNFEFSKAE